VREVEPPVNMFGAIFMAVAAVVQIGIGVVYCKYLKSWQCTFQVFGKISSDKIFAKKRESP
jgi:hypothetical protein